MKKISLKWAGIIAMICAPALCIQVNFFIVPGHKNSYAGGIFDLLFITGWICSILGLIQLQAAGTKRAGKIVLFTQLIMLSLSNIWNVWEIFEPDSNHILFRILDITWPVNMALSLFTAVAVLVAKRLPGYQRFIPLAVPVCAAIIFALFSIGAPGILLTIMTICTIVAWGSMGFVIYQNRQKKGAGIPVEEYPIVNTQHMVPEEMTEPVY